MKRLRYGVKCMSCAACVAHVERAAAKICDRSCINVSLLTNSLTVTVEDGTDEKKLYSSLNKALSDVGYGLTDGSESEEKEKNKDLPKWIVCAVLTVILMYVAMGDMIGLWVPPFLTENGVK